MPTVLLPWPDKRLSPNHRIHHMPLARLKKAYRAVCGWECKASGLRRMDADALHLAITFHPPDKRKRDLDNMLSALKSGLDGIQDVVGVDDSAWSLTIKRGDPVKHGRVVIDISEIS